MGHSQHLGTINCINMNELCLLIIIFNISLKKYTNKRNICIEMIRHIDFFIKLKETCHRASDTVLNGFMFYTLSAILSEMDHKGSSIACGGFVIPIISNYV